MHHSVPTCSILLRLDSLFFSKTSGRRPAYDSRKCSSVKSFWYIGFLLPSFCSDNFFLVASEGCLPMCSFSFVVHIVSLPLRLSQAIKNSGSSWETVCRAADSIHYIISIYTISCDYLLDVSKSWLLRAFPAK